MITSQTASTSSCDENWALSDRTFRGLDSVWAERLIEDTGRVIWALWVGASSGHNNDDLIMCVNACVCCSNQKKKKKHL